LLPRVLTKKPLESLGLVLEELIVNVVNDEIGIMPVNLKLDEAAALLDLLNLRTFLVKREKRFILLKGFNALVFLCYPFLIIRESL
jgi:hypothetical protein